MLTGRSTAGVLLAAECLRSLRFLTQTAQLGIPQSRHDVFGKFLQRNGCGATLAEKMCQAVAMRSVEAELYQSSWMNSAATSRIDGPGFARCQSEITICSVGHRR
jgi:hypothetical protein